MWMHIKYKADRSTSFHLLINHPNKGTGHVHESEKDLAYVSTCISNFAVLVLGESRRAWLENNFKNGER